VAERRLRAAGRALGGEARPAMQQQEAEEEEEEEEAAAGGSAHAAHADTGAA